jgi:hypothetical protein
MAYSSMFECLLYISEKKSDYLFFNPKKKTFFVVHSLSLSNVRVPTLPLLLCALQEMKIFVFILYLFIYVYNYIFWVI